MKVKLDENISFKLLEVLRHAGHDTDTVADEGLTGLPDQDVWAAAQAEGRFLVTQDLDFSDSRRFAPGTHAGVLLVRLREPGAGALVQAVSAVADQFHAWPGCFVVLSERKLRVRRP